MIILDTHIWAWWVDESPRLSERHRVYIAEHESDGVAISVISCWEIAKLVEYGRFEPSIPLLEWMDCAVAFHSLNLVELTPHIAVESTQLPGTFHKDPSDQIIVATARLYDATLLTIDSKILTYPHVKTF